MATDGKIFVTRRIRDAGLDLLRDAGVELRVWPGPENARPSREEVLEGARWADVLLSLLTEPVDHEVMAANPQLRGVANFAVGFDNIDVTAATALGIPVSNTPGVLTDTTADLTWALLLAAARNVVAGDVCMRGGNYKVWGPNLLLGEDVSPGGDGRRKVLGILGFGRIGQAVARRALGFEMRVLAHDPFARAAIEADAQAEWAELDDLLRESDFVSVHTLLSEETRHLISTRELGLMKPTAYLINAARGPIVDEQALVEALRKKQIAGAGLDVYENEPAMAEGLAELENAVLLPHLGSATRGTRDLMATKAATNALAMLRREPAPNCVNPEVYASAAYRARRG
ncbi:MAG: D-glycerate dehydrogenase [Myxococcales bacterium]|nr:D-glycerate dehydrogenase [Myxococcales bacterium]MDH5306257.1 D-glycerate dehydrogenase [Myxococcales bacterium]